MTSIVTQKKRSTIDTIDSIIANVIKQGRYLNLPYFQIFTDKEKVVYLTYPYSLTENIAVYFKGGHSEFIKTAGRYQPISSLLPYYAAAGDTRKVIDIVSHYQIPILSIDQALHQAASSNVIDIDSRFKIINFLLDRGSTKGQINAFKQAIVTGTGIIYNIFVYLNRKKLITEDMLNEALDSSIIHNRLPLVNFFLQHIGSKLKDIKEEEYRWIDYAYHMKYYSLILLLLRYLYVKFDSSLYIQVRKAITYRILSEI